MKCSIGVFAYNEEKNIGPLLRALLGQETQEVEIDEIIVVASGCTDRTVEIAQQYAKKDPRIQVVVQEKREGKAAAINVFLDKANNAIVVIESGDTIPAKNTVEYLVKPFFDPLVGMTGAHPVPVDDRREFMGFITHLLWDLHHHISLQSPKMGEMVAFRKLSSTIPLTAVDEAMIESEIKKAGYQIKYVPEAIVYNKGPRTISDFLRQRRRIHAGHLRLQKETGHTVSTRNPLGILGVLLRNYARNYVRNYGVRAFLFIPAAIIIEGTGKALGYWDYYVMRRDHRVWEIAKSTKDLRA